jgi:predicted kinase
VAALIHLNGPPGIGKSTLAALYVDRHPGSLNLDIDTLHRLVGGWQTEDGRTHDILRPVALAMAGAQLAEGRDVVLPQYLAAPAEIEAFERVASDHGARFFEVVLLADRAEAISRFERRADRSEWDSHNRRVVARHGGADFLAVLHDRLLDVIRRRPDAVVVESEPAAVERTYAELVRVLSADG